MPTIIVCLDADCPSNDGADATCPCCGRLAVAVRCRPDPAAVARAAPLLRLHP